MRIEIEIPKEFEIDYNGDRFKDFFSRVLCDIEEGRCLCGNYEKETAEMFLKAFDESKPAYDPDAVVADIEDFREEAEQFGFASALSDIVEVVRNGGVHE